MKLFFILFISVLFFGCEKKELPVKKYNRGDVITAQIDMEPNYKNQVWYRLSDNKIVSTNLRTDWDLAFEASQNGWHIMLNGANAMKVYKTNFAELSQVNDTAGLAINSKADMPGGNLDSTAIGNWQADNKVYIINRGYNEAGQMIGFYKFKITAQTATQYTFEYGNVFDSQTFQGVVNKDDAYNFINFSFALKMPLNSEPKKSDFDLCFTSYTYLFYDPLQYYQVTGVLAKEGTRIVKVNDKGFADIVINDTTGKTFQTNRDAIGYEWKSFNLNNNLYTVDVNKCYIINDTKGFYYKLHFIDFYNSSGLKGFPKFEFKKL